MLKIYDMKIIAFISQHISKQPGLPAKAAACLFLVFLLSSVSSAMENCSQSGGKCRQTCAQNEVIEQGAFTDCAEKEECCVEAPETKAFRCCITSLDTVKSGALNCFPAVDGQCSKGIGHPSECSDLIYCKEKK